MLTCSENKVTRKFAWVHGPFKHKKFREESSSGSEGLGRRRAPRGRGRRGWPRPPGPRALRQPSGPSPALGPRVYTPSHDSGFPVPMRGICACRGDGGSGWSPRPSGPGRAPPPSGTQRQWRCPRGRVYPNSPRPLAGSAEPWRGSVRGEYRSGVNLCVPSISDTERRRPLGIPPRPQLPPGGPMRRPDMRVAASELTAAWPSGRPGEEVGGLLAVVGPPCPGRTARGPCARTAPWSTGPCPWIPVPADQPRV